MKSNCNGRKCVLSALSGVLLLFAAAATGLDAQVAATISGTVTDSSGAAVSGAKVDVTNTGTGITQNSATDAQGRYSVPELPVGDYRVQAAASGFQNMVHTGITLTVGAQSVVDFSLPVGQSQQTVTVEGEVAQVETTSTSLSTVVEPTQMRELPLNGRNYESLLTLIPGVAPVAATGGVFGAFYGTQQNYSVSGSRPEGQLFLLDNANTADFFQHGSGSGALGTSLGIDGIAEFQTLTNTYSAQFGGNGAVVNAVTKSGTNAFHGSVYEFLRNNDLDARNFFDTSHPGGGPPEFRRNQFGGTFGGPIKKDKLFFFVNDEALRQVQGVSAIVTVPDANAHQGILPTGTVGVSPAVASTLALFPLPSTEVLTATGQPTGTGQLTEVANQRGNENYALGRLDYTRSAKDSFFLRYVSDRATYANPFGGSAIPLWAETDITRNQYVTAQWTRLISPTLINEARVSYVRPVEAQSLSSSTPALNFFPDRPVPGTVNIGGLTGIGGNGFLPDNFYTNKFSEADDVLWTHGSHNIKFGFSVERIDDNTSQALFFGGTWSFASLASFLGGRASTLLGPPEGKSDGYKDFRSVFLTPYLQDDWKVTSKLTLNLGLRYDWEGNPTEVNHPMTTLINAPFGTYTPVSQVFASNPSTKNFDPRIGIAYDPFADHKTSIRAGFGIFHDVIQGRLYAGNYWLNPPYSINIQIQPTYPIPFATGGIIPPPSVSEMEGVDYHFGTTPYAMQYNFNIQRELGGGNVLTVGYVGSAGVHLVESYDSNAPIPRIAPDGRQIFGTFAPPTVSSGPAINPLPRQNPAYSYISLKEPWGHSNYNSLQASLHRRLLHNLQAQISYTWSKSLDDDSTSSSLEGAGQDIADPYNASLDRGPSGFNRGQSFVASAVYLLPFHKNKLTDGWQISTIFSVLSGNPFSVVTGYDQTGIDDLSVRRPDLVAGCSQNPTLGKVNDWFNAACFAAPPNGELGTLGRNTLIGPGFWDLDFAVMKNTRITEKLTAQFRVEAFNIFNHPDFNSPNPSLFTLGATGSAIPNPLAGQITSTVNAPRQIQFALKLLF
ncbi:MAG TPA: TonB-dependent receptor [Bryobacteraceae bacterium]|nr:TonB-dependent receptor [Bryobacteraceae bacterium]